LRTVLRPNFQGFLLLITGLPAMLSCHFILGQSISSLPDTSHKKNQVYVSGFIETEYQVAQTKGISSYSGGDFSKFSDNRFLIRRGRPRIVYKRYNDKQDLNLEVVMEIDGTNKGVTINEFWGRIYENKWNLFSLATGMLVRPFGFEISQPTRTMESPERGRMSQTLMHGEVDLGGMLIVEAKKRNDFLHYFKLSAGVFNGEGLTAPGEYDSYKDIITRACINSYPLKENKLFLTTGISLLNGGIAQGTKYIYRLQSLNDNKQFIVDSSLSNIGQKDPRQYYGVDASLKLNHRSGATELRAEYWWGTQTSSAISTETPTTILTDPLYIRHFNGAFFYLLHNVINAHHQLCIKYDWYDPNVNVNGQDIGKLGSNLTPADIKYTTIGLGYNYYVNDNFRLLLWYDIVKNEKTQSAGYYNDLKDNVLTIRIQLRF
jgi:hypothetical protein